MKTKTMFGTNNFVSIQSACKYYREYGINANTVREKIQSGEIIIGKPECKSDAEIVLIDNETRYGVIC